MKFCIMIAFFCFVGFAYAQSPNQPTREDLLQEIKSYAERHVNTGGQIKTG